MRSVPLRTVADVRLGRQRSPQNSDGPHMTRYLRAANVKSGRLELDDVKEMNFTPDEQEVFRLEPGDVLVTEGAGSLDAVGAAAAWRGELAGTVCVQNTLVRLRPRPNVEPRFLAWWAEHAYTSRAFANFASGANIFHLGAEGVRGMPFPGHDVADQRRIADYLDAETGTMDELSGAKRQMVTLAEAGFARRISEATRATSTLQVNDDLCAQVPAGWSSPLLARCFATVAYGIGEASRPSGSVAVLGMGNVNDLGQVVGSPGGYVDAVDGELQLRPGDLLFNRTNSRSKVGKLALVEQVDGPTTVASYLVIIRVTQIAHAPYLNYALNSKEVLGLARSMALPSIGQANLNPSRYGRIRIALPTLERQQEIASDLHAMEYDVLGLTRTLERQIRVLAELRRALITAAVTGEIQVA